MGRRALLIAGPLAALLLAVAGGEVQPRRGHARSLLSARSRTAAAKSAFPYGKRKDPRTRFWKPAAPKKKETPPAREKEEAAAADAEDLTGAASTYAKFHGMYPCPVGSPCPSYSAAFLASRTQLLHNGVSDAKMRRKNTNMETASYHAMGGAGKYDVWRTVDALDYAVEHLSMYERMVHSSKTGADKASAIGDAVYGTFVDRLAAYEATLKRRCGGDDPALRNRTRTTAAERTVGVMPLYAGGHAGGAGHAEKSSMAGLGSGHTRYESKALCVSPD